jgi:alkyl sulfatase BDS1-like metallo-beta-lactamase superfamily hydrolase
MADLLKLSTDIIEQTNVDPDFIPGPVNRINHELSELTGNIAMVEAFSHSIVFKTDDGLVVFDTSGDRGGSRVVDAIRGWSGDRFNTLVYTHGHIDHVGGCGAFLANAEANNHGRPTIAGHENVARRFDRYNFTDGYNKVINERQFRSFIRRGYDIGGSGSFLPQTTPAPDLTYRDHLNISVGGLEIEMHHANGETDDHTWAWLPAHKAICAGDFFIWNFPNAGNPQKVQRYPVEWAAAMRDMADQGAELFLPAHGLPIEGATRIRVVLTDVAEALEFLVEETISLMNDGAALNDIVHSVHIPQSVLDKPYLRPMYDEPEFVVRNIWRMYGGWYDGNPANLKPAKDAAVASEIAAMAGGAGALAKRALTVADDDMRLACHLVELAVQAEPENKNAHGARSEIYQRRREQETSLMAKGIFGYAARESQEKSGEGD